MSTSPIEPPDLDCLVSTTTPICFVNFLRPVLYALFGWIGKAPTSSPEQ